MKRLILFLIVFGFACNATATPINTTAKVVTSITIPDQLAFDIISIAGGVMGLNLSFNMDGTTSYAPQIFLLADDQKGVAQSVRASSSTFATIAVTLVSLGSEGDTALLVGPLLVRESNGFSASRELTANY
ncbi:MAG TPA: hypothetical protein VIS49_09235 [Cyclobacteriaceae bacterium]